MSSETLFPIYTDRSWDRFYEKEIANFSENNLDTGENWFDDSDAERKVIEFFTRLIEDGELDSSLKVLDLGTGNGHFLLELHEEAEEVECNLELHGIDYSPKSIELARLVAAAKLPDENISYEVVDFIAAECQYLQDHRGQFDVVFDKGTLDAIALNNAPVAGFDKIASHVYPGQVVQLMHAGSVLFVTSCNFTEDELTRLVTENGANALEVWKRIEYPSIQFGGAKGLTICTLAFMKK